MVRRAFGLGVVLAFIFVACKKEPPPTAAGTKVLTWTRSGYSGLPIVETGPDVVDARELAVSFADGPLVRIGLKVTHGTADVTYKDGSKAGREIPRRIEAELIEATPLHVGITCSADVSGPVEKKPIVLYAPCEITAASAAQGQPQRAVIVVYGDGDVQSEPSNLAPVIVTPAKVK